MFLSGGIAQIIWVRYFTLGQVTQIDQLAAKITRSPSTVNHAVLTSQLSGVILGCWCLGVSWGFLLQSTMLDPLYLIALSAPRLPKFTPIKATGERILNTHAPHPPCYRAHSMALSLSESRGHCGRFDCWVRTLIYPLMGLESRCYSWEEETCRCRYIQVCQRHSLSLNWITDALWAQRWWLLVVTDWDLDLHWTQLLLWYQPSAIQESMAACFGWV